MQSYKNFVRTNFVCAFCFKCGPYEHPQPHIDPVTFHSPNKKNDFNNLLDNNAKKFDDNRVLFMKVLAGR